MKTTNNSSTAIIVRLAYIFRVLPSIYHGYLSWPVNAWKVRLLLLQFVLKELTDAHISNDRYLLPGAQAPRD